MSFFCRTVVVMIIVLSSQALFSQKISSNDAKHHKGLFYALKKPSLKFLPEGDLFAVNESPSISEKLITLPAKRKIIDPLFEPVFLMRFSFVNSQAYSFKDDSTGIEGTSEDLARTFLGYRKGFVMENFEVGFKGRHNETGVYYAGKLELVPREKDGTKEDNYLKEVYVGWNYYSVADFQAGLIKIPLGQQLLKSSTEMPLIYSPLINTFLPKRLLGTKATFNDPYKIVSFTAGVFNSAKQSYDQMTDTKYLMYALRGEFSVSNLFTSLNMGRDRLFKLKLGASYAYTEENFENPATEMSYMGFDGHLDVYIFTFEAEYMVRNFFTENITPRKSLQSVGWYFDATVHVWADVLDLTLRVENADGNTDSEIYYATGVSEAVNQEKQWYTVGMMFHLTHQLDMELNYIHRDEAEGISIDNNVFITTLQFNL